MNGYLVVMMTPEVGRKIFVNIFAALLGTVHFCTLEVLFNAAKGCMKNSGAVQCLVYEVNCL